MFVEDDQNFATTIPNEVAIKRLRSSTSGREKAKQRQMSLWRAHADPKMEFNEWRAVGQKDVTLVLEVSPAANPRFHFELRVTPPSKA